MTTTKTRVLQWASWMSIAGSVAVWITHCVIWLSGQLSSRDLWLIGDEPGTAVEYLTNNWYWGALSTLSLLVVIVSAFTLLLLSSAD